MCIDWCRILKVKSPSAEQAECDGLVPDCVFIKIIDGQSILISCSHDAPSSENNNLI